MGHHVLTTLGSLLALALSAATQNTLPPGCNADNPVRALQNHANQGAAAFCGSLLPGVHPTTMVPSYVATTTGGTTSTSTFLPYRNTYFMNAQSIKSPPPITYTNNKPSVYASQPTMATPSYLATYDYWRLYTACACAFPQEPQTTTYAATAAIRPTYTQTDYFTPTPVPGPEPTYAAACNPSIFVGFPHLFTSVSVARPFATVAPKPYANTRADCCQLCANTFNCLWWQHSAAGACTYAWATDVQNRTDYNDYEQCPNGNGPAGTVQFFGVAPRNQPDAIGRGACAGGDSDIPGEKQSNWDSMELEYKFNEMCAFYGGQYCTTNFKIQA